MPWWGIMLIGIGALLVGAVVGFFVALKVFKRMQEKNPPINEDMIRTMFRQMGVAPSEKRVRQVMESMKQKQ